MCYACITLTTISVILDDPLENCCQKFICQKPLSKCLWSEEFSQLFTYSNTENCQSTKSGSTVYISRLTIQDLLEKLFLSSVSKWLLCLVSCSLLNCNDHCKLLQKTYQNPWYCFSMGVNQEHLHQQCLQSQVISKKYDPGNKHQRFIYRAVDNW